MADTGAGYRTKEEVAAIRQNRDSIEQAKNWILEHQVATKEELKKEEKRIRKELDGIVEKIRQSED